MTNISMAACANLPPLLFLTFRSLYGISYSLLGTLVLLFYCTQLGIDLVFSFFSHKFNISLTVKLMPVLTLIGLVLFALAPILFPSAVFLGLIIATVIFSLSAGLAEVLMSPVIAAIPSDDPDRSMSLLHSFYAWGVVGVVILSTLYLLLAGTEHWQWLPIIFALIPLAAAVLFFSSEIPRIETPNKASGALKCLKNRGTLLCVLAIFLGGATECNMSQWASTYLEAALGIDKIWGDIFGVAMFAVMLGMGRSLYSKIGRNIERVLLCCSVGAVACYLICAISPFPVLGLIACAMTGLASSMLWPGSLIVASDRHPEGGVFIYAMMAAGGDFGASVAPQLVGIVTDLAIANDAVSSFASRLGLLPEQLGMKLGMLVGMVFPLAAIFVFLHILRTKRSDMDASAGLASPDSETV